MEAASKRNYAVYILECADGTYYVGMTKDIEHRLLQHNGIKSGGARYTRTRQPVTIQYYEECGEFKTAALRERSLKKLKKEAKRKLIASCKLIAVGD